jgi:hypothetical protein
MPLVLEPSRYSRESLAGIVRELRAELDDARELIDHPRGPVRDPSGIEAAKDLVNSAVTLLDAPGERDVADLAREANLAYAALVAVIDLVKSHSDAPRVPQRRA